MENAESTTLGTLPEKTSKEQLVLLEKYADQLLQNERDTIKKAEDRSLSILTACSIAITVIGYIFTAKAGASELSKIISIAAVLSSVIMVGKCFFYISKTIRPIQIPQFSRSFIQDSAALTEVAMLRDVIETKVYLHEHYQNVAMEKMLYFDRALRSFINIFPLVCAEIFSIVLNEQFKKLDLSVTGHFLGWALVIGTSAVAYTLLVNRVQEHIRRLWQPKIRREPSSVKQERQTTLSLFQRILAWFGDS